MTAASLLENGVIQLFQQPVTVTWQPHRTAGHVWVDLGMCQLREGGDSWGDLGWAQQKVRLQDGLVVRWLRVDHHRSQQSFCARLQK